MKNIEKYTNTKEALEAYNALGLKNVPFDEWLEGEYEKSRNPTLLDAADYVVKAWFADLPEIYLGKVSSAISILSAAIEHEKHKQVCNLERFATDMDAHEAFIKFCDNQMCKNCRFGNRSKRSGCAIAWLYANAGKEEAR